MVLAPDPAMVPAQVPAPAVMVPTPAPRYLLTHRQTPDPESCRHTGRLQHLVSCWLSSRRQLPVSCRRIGRLQHLVSCWLSSRRQLPVSCRCTDRHKFLPESPLKFLPESPLKFLSESPLEFPLESPLKPSLESPL
ncbi:hypothetical protein CgunFtcFv8_019391 [Champsocephalus gunnari]|uniref:Uncharacterized protein n=1 Tax=Champsocephalus gunnari TaxID=52237 RepID=A0AAN8DPX6_CHAGU|nr:hypothetical protein CgunFtcFv8_019391 [Champsocephalus gunnari]